TTKSAANYTTSFLGDNCCIWSELYVQSAKTRRKSPILRTVLQRLWLNNSNYTLGVVFCSVAIGSPFTRLSIL
ncbi:MAG: hypothetical protein QNJ53_13095, partial [Pleurocapsa sp. MO_192.B19]|nr:hypothetical protein [Pleurocapsa sp. MO_192.B19]